MFDLQFCYYIVLTNLRFRTFNIIWFFIVVSFLLAKDPAYAQTIPCNMTFKDGKGMNNTRMVGLHEDLLLVTDTGTYKIINIEKISLVKFDNGSYFWTGVGVGAAAGFIGGFVYYEIWGGKKHKIITRDAAAAISLIFTVPCALIGGLIGLNFRNVDSYDLSKMRTDVKAVEIKFMMKDHSLWQ